jgi:gamma-glutamyltranspeptidase/glutathione hydrolase
MYAMAWIALNVGLTRYDKMVRSARIIYFFLIIFFAICLSSCDQSNNQSRHQNLVSAATPQAMDAGKKIFLIGGNAADAAVATAFALAVSEPAMAGIGGGVQVLISPPGEEPFVMNGTTFSPLSMPQITSRGQIKGITKTTVPSFVMTLSALHQQYGSGLVSWQKLIEPSVKLARDGFTIGSFREKVYRKYVQALRDSPGAASFYLFDEQAPGVGDTIRFPILAQTLERIGQYGAEDFYTGLIAEKILEDMERHQGWITEADLKSMKPPDIRKALHIQYHGYDIYTMPPPGAGWVLIRMLQYMYAQKIKQTTSDSLLDWYLIRAMMLGHQDRAVSPLPDIVLYEAYVNERIEAKNTVERISSFSANWGNEDEKDTGETTHFSVLDSAGLAISVTTSINAYFGARVASEELGFLYNSYMDDFKLDTLHAHRFRPGAMAYSSMTPTIVKKDGEIFLIFGSPGSKRIISSVFQILHYIIDRGMSPEEAIQRHRIHAINGKVLFETNGPSEELIKILQSENLEWAQANTSLSVRNHNAYFGGVHAIARNGDRYITVQDIRRDGYSVN